jgi:hypothetical protein
MSDIQESTWIEHWDRVISSAPPHRRQLREELERAVEELPSLARFVHRLIAYSMTLRRHISYRDAGAIAESVHLTPIGPEPSQKHLEFLCALSPSACRCFTDPTSCDFGDNGSQEPLPPSCDQTKRRFCGAARCLLEICDRRDLSESDQNRMFDCKETLDSAWSDLLSAGCINDSRVLPNLGQLRDFGPSLPG